MNDDIDCDGIINSDDDDADGDGTPEFDTDGITLLDCDDSNPLLESIENDLDCDGIINVMIMMMMVMGSMLIRQMEQHL